MLETMRHMELFNNHKWNKQGTPVHIIGAGATGSWLALCLAKLGITDITVWDFDVVEEHNIANQAYRVDFEYNNATHTDVGYKKVDALGDVVYSMTGTKINEKDMKVTGDTRLSGIVFMMTDTMASRKEIYEKAIKFTTRTALLIEPRMGLDMGRVYCIDPNNLKQCERYEQTLYSDEEAAVSACGASQSVVTTAMNMASMCARQLINWFNGQKLPNEILIDYKYNNFLTQEW